MRLQDESNEPFPIFEMSPILGYLTMAQSAVNGIGKSFDKAAIAADQVARAGAEFSGTDPVTMSPEAIAAARSGDSAPKGGIERPMVDLRVAKYSAAANVRVLQTADEMSRALTAIGGRAQKP